MYTNMIDRSCALHRVGPHHKPLTISLYVLPWAVVLSSLERSSYEYQVLDSHDGVPRGACSSEAKDRQEKSGSCWHCDRRLSPDGKLADTSRNHHTFPRATGPLLLPATRSRPYLPQASAWKCDCFRTQRRSDVATPAQHAASS